MASLGPLEIETAWHLMLTRVREGVDLIKAVGVLQSHWGAGELRKATNGGPGDHGIPAIGRQELSYFKNLTDSQKKALSDVLDLVDQLYEANGGKWDGIDPWDATQPLEEWKAATMSALATEPMKAFLLGQALATEEAAKISRALGGSGHKLMRPILPEDRRIIDYLTHHTFNEVDRSFEDLKHEFRNQLIGGIATGANPKVVARAMRDIHNDFTTDWERLAITETARAETAGRLQELKDQGFTEFIGSSAHDSKTCDHCLRLIDGKVHRIADVEGRSNYGKKAADWGPYIPVHPRCVAAGQEVLTPDGRKRIELIRPGEYVLTHRARFRRVLATASRKHSGVILDVGGLRVTGNHPVLTPDGFRTASSLGEVADVLGINREAWRDIRRADDSHDSPSERREHGVLGFIVSALLRRPLVPAASVDFNGEHGIGNREVDIEFVDRVLRGCLDPDIFQMVVHRLLQTTHSRGALDANSSRSLRFDGLLRAANGFMCGGNLSFALAGVHTAPLDALGFGFTAPGESKFSKPSSKREPRTASLLVKLIDGFSRQVFGMPDADLLAGGARFAPTVRSERVCDALFDGHVYDLQVREDESFVVEGIAVHNCRCVALPYSAELARVA